MNILLDLDGVMCNWTGAVARLFGTTYEELLNKWPAGESRTEVPLGITEEEMWGAVHGQGDKFWEELEEYPWSKDLYKTASLFGDVYFLTSPGTEHAGQACEGKINWMKRFTGNNKFRDYLIGRPKFLCANKSNVLIDDYDRNIKEYRSIGGDCILFPQIWNKNHAIQTDKIDYIYDQLLAMNKA